MGFDPRDWKPEKSPRVPTPPTRTDIEEIIADLDAGKRREERRITGRSDIGTRTGKRIQSEITLPTANEPVGTEWRPDPPCWAHFTIWTSAAVKLHLGLQWGPDLGPPFTADKGQAVSGARLYGGGDPLTINVMWNDPDGLYDPESDGPVIVHLDGLATSAN